jgi:predicted P-loop ATPase
MESIKDELKQTDKLLFFLETSVGGWNIEYGGNGYTSLNDELYSTVGYLRAKFAEYLEGRDCINDLMIDSFFAFSDSIFFNIDVYRDYNEFDFTDDKKTLVRSSRSTSYIEDKYEDAFCPYMELKKHKNFIELMADKSIYNNLLKKAIEEVKRQDEHTLNEIKNRLSAIGQSIQPQTRHKHKDNSVRWHSAVKRTLDEIQTVISKKLQLRERDIKSFIYILNLVFEKAGFTVSKGTDFAYYLSIFLNEEPKTIDKYFKRINNEKSNTDFWGNNDTAIKKLLSIVEFIESFNPKEETLKDLKRSIVTTLSKFKLNDSNDLSEKQKKAYRKLLQSSAMK